PDSEYATNSHANRSMVDPPAPGTIQGYTEAQFLLAEAAARSQESGAGYTVGTPEEHYEAAITACFNKWETPGAADYLAKPEVDYDQATQDKSWKEVIGTQEWLGLYGRSFAPYLSVRRL